MQLYKTSEYAIRVLVYMAAQDREIFSVMRLHRELQLPYKYLGRLMRHLAKSKLLRSSRGKMGGYRFARPCTEIYLAEIIEAVEGMESYDRCLLGFPSCSDDNPCPLHHLWGKHRDGFKEALRTTSLADLPFEGTQIS